jgi:hypothetical protein
MFPASNNAFLQLYFCRVRGKNNIVIQIVIEGRITEPEINMKTGLHSWLMALALLSGINQAVAQPTILSTVPTNGATDVSPAAAVVFTFSTNMNPTTTTAFFNDVTAEDESPSVNAVWSAGNTVLTCTPSPDFANNHNIEWDVSGEDTNGNILTGTMTGDFTTVPGVDGGSGTNAVTTFLVGTYWFYDQTNAAPPILYPVIPYEFYAQTTLTSNRTATNITVTLPTSSISNLVEDLLEPENFSLVAFKTSLTNFSTNFPAGNYTFNVSATTSNQQVTVNLPDYVQPNAPQVINYTAAQSINPSQPFTLTWNTFTNGTSTDWILFEIGKVFQSPAYGQPGFLNGTATSVTIPAATLPASSTNNADLIFYHIVSTTNGGNVTGAFVGSLTAFSIITTGSAATPMPQLTISPSGTTVILEWPTNTTGFTLQSTTNLSPAVWSSNSPAPVVVNTNEVVTNTISGRQQFFRLDNP